MKSKFLSNLYTLLVKLSPDGCSHPNVLGDDAVSMAVTNKWFRTRIKLLEITSLSNLLFRKLNEEFELLISGSGFIPPSTRFEDKDILKLDQSSSHEEFLLLLRCCMTMLNFLEFDQSLVLEKCQILNGILRRLGHLPDVFSCHCHFESEIASKVSHSESIALHPCTFAHGGMMLVAGALPSFSCRILEVFIHDLLLHQQFRKHVVITDYVTEMPAKLFASHCDPGDLSAIFEVVSFHFLLSVRDERASLKFIQSLSWSTGFLETAELSVPAILALFGIPVMLTAPYMLQAHLILLASKCIGFLIPNDDGIPDDAIFDCCMSAFELSVNLYGCYISALESTELPSRDEVATSSLEEPNFGSYIKLSTKDKINFQIQNLVDFCETHLSGFLSRDKAQFLNDSFSYISENQQIIDLSCREKGSLILNCLVSYILSKEAANTMPCKDGRILQVECCLAAVLKLMSSSLLKILWFLKQNSCLGGKKIPTGNHCSEYKFVTNVIHSFGKYNAHRYVKNILFNECDVLPEMHKEIELLFEHFSSLALYGFNRRLTFLWNGCLFMMMTVTNLLQFEKDKFVALNQLLGHAHETSITQFSAPKSLQGKVLQSSSLQIASNLQYLHELYLRNKVNSSPCGDECMDIGQNRKGDEQDDNADGASVPGIQEHADEADVCNGKIFLDCLSGCQNSHSEWEGLADFIECKPGKDYSYWLRSRKVFRKWQNGRIAVGKKWQRKVKTRRKIY